MPGRTLSQGVSLMTRIKGASGTLSRLPGMLEQARETARDLRQQPNSKEGLLTLAREVGKMDKGLAEVQALAAEFREGIQLVENRFRYYHGKAARWIHLGGILIPLLLLWLGAGQAALVLIGGHLLMKKGAIKSDSFEAQMPAV
jgi:hypothetical protein